MKTATSLLRSASLYRVQAQKCRDLISVISDAHAISVLQDYAEELDSRAQRVELEAYGHAQAASTSESSAFKGNAG